MTATGDNSLARYSSRSRVAGRNAMSSAMITPAIKPQSGHPKSRLHDDIVERLVAQVAVEIGREVAPAAVGGAFGKARAVRRDQHGRQFVERQRRAAAVRMVGAPMLPPDVERGAAESLVAQRLVQRLLIDDRGAADI